MAFHQIKHPLILDKLTRMRKTDTSSKDFRENLDEIAGLMVYEISRDLVVDPIEIETPIAETTGYTLNKPVVLVPIIRAGLGMVAGIQKLIPTSKVAHVGLYRDEITKQPVEYFAKKTDDIENSYVLIVDPMLATGGSAIKCLDIVKGWGVKDVKFVCLVATPEGVNALQTAYPDLEIYAAAMDEKLNSDGYIVPGLGDAGDRIFGTK